MGVQVYKCMGVQGCTTVLVNTVIFTLKCKNKDMISKHLLPI